MPVRSVIRRLSAAIGGGLGLLALMVQPLPAAASGTGTLFAIVTSQAKMAKVDPVTGGLTPIADLSVPQQMRPGFSNSIASDPAAHRLFVNRSFFDFATFPPVVTYQLITIDSRTGALTAVQGLSRPVVALAFDSSSGGLFGVTGDCCPSQVIRIDPATGALARVADLPGEQQLGFVASAPAKHALYLSSESFATRPPTTTILTIDTVTGAVSASPALAQGISSLAYDSSLDALFGTTFCCPAHFVRVDPTTAAETFVGTWDFGHFLEFGLTIDSASHTAFAVQDIYEGFRGPTAHIVSINVLTGAGVLGGSTGENLASIVFEPISITPESVKADVRSALASGAIVSEGIARSLLAKLNAAGAARASAQCGVASEIYGAFINELNAQSGKHVAAATADKLISEAQFLIANCP